MAGEIEAMTSRRDNTFDVMELRILRVWSLRQSIRKEFTGTDSHSRHRDC